MNSVFSKLLLVAVVQLALFPIAAEARNCMKGKACGNSCISQKDVCHVDVVAQAPGRPATRVLRDSTSGATTSASEAPPVVPAQSAPIPNQPAAAAPAATTAAPATAKVRQCKKGKACGNSCIPMKSECHA